MVFFFFFQIFLNLSQNWIKCKPGFLTSLYLNKIIGYFSHNQCYDYCEYECFFFFFFFFKLKINSPFDSSKLRYPHVQDRQIIVGLFVQWIDDKLKQER